ncbi:MAG: ribonuclease Z [Asgard group archaeon]|nr:ribonuclease Z [Asgard group archaeon]
MSSIRIVFLGTSAAVPQKERYLSSIAMQRENGEIFLFDCGEGTQFRLMEFNVNFQKITRIFLSHLHGDHLYGIFGLLSTMKQMERTKPLVVYGPVGTREFFTRVYGPTENYGFKFPLDIQMVDEGLVYDEEDHKIMAKRTMHSVYTLAYAYLEKDRLGRFNKDKAIALKVDKGEKWQKLQKGESVLSSDNKVITPDMILGSSRRGFKIIFAYDGLYAEEEFVPFALDADVLIMEATYSDDNIELAEKKLHSTARWSAKIAKKANAKRLYLTHISARFKEVDSLEKQAQEEYPGAIIAYDGLEINLNRRDLENE